MIAGGMLAPPPVESHGEGRSEGRLAQCFTPRLRAGALPSSFLVHSQPQLVSLVY